MAFASIRSDILLFLPCGGCLCGVTILVIGCEVMEKVRDGQNSEGITCSWGKIKLNNLLCSLFSLIFIIFAQQIMY